MFTTFNTFNNSISLSSAIKITNSSVNALDSALSGLIYHYKFLVTDLSSNNGLIGIKNYSNNNYDATITDTTSTSMSTTSHYTDSNRRSFLTASGNTMVFNSFPGLSTNGFTLSFWMLLPNNLTNNTYINPFYIGTNNSTVDGIMLQVLMSSNNTFDLYLYNVAGLNNKPLGTYANTGWMNICIVQSSTQLVLYINGVSSGSYSSSGYSGLTWTKGSFGASNYGTNNCSTALYDELRLYNKPLSSSQVSTIYTL
jgi:hypothetical protein